ncbi:hypothetical protein AAFF_G00201530 [Aldrovandia affinis]|uniref:Uncharacterized protein n=1 Tax=Aldrovandia affinis TaxID=143900 RepID=A0AAD7WUX7_9TELE|nr:hypothetical protein AAFF_G00201530 [Aldrovandia affinis]
MPSKLKQHSARRSLDSADFRAVVSEVILRALEGEAGARPPGFGSALIGPGRGPVGGLGLTFSAQNLKGRNLRCLPPADLTAARRPFTATAAVGDFKKTSQGVKRWGSRAVVLSLHSD